MTATRSLRLRREDLTALVTGLVDGILTALTFATGDLISASRTLNPESALRIGAAGAISGAFVFFAAEYARMRHELVRAEQELNLTSHGRLAATHLGRSVFFDAVRGTGLSSTSSLLGALLPLFLGSIIASPSWLPIAISILTLALLGFGLGRAVYGNVLRWALGLAAAGSILAFVGAQLHVI